MTDAATENQIATATDAMAEDLTETATTDVKAGDVIVIVTTEEVTGETA